MARNVRGIDVDLGGNLVVRNDATLNTTNFDIVPGNADANVASPGSNFLLLWPLGKLQTLAASFGAAHRTMQQSPRI